MIQPRAGRYIKGSPDLPGRGSSVYTDLEEKALLEKQHCLLKQKRISSEEVPEPHGIDAELQYSLLIESMAVARDHEMFQNLSVFQAAPLTPRPSKKARQSKQLLQDVAAHVCKGSHVFKASDVQGGSVASTDSATTPVASLASLPSTA
eukprot:6479112-Amphidinium_carterae.1